MKIFKWVLVIAITVAATCVLMSTLMQQEFQVSVPTMIFSWGITQPVPIYIFIAAAFGIGLAIGFFAAAYYYIKGQAGIHNKKKEIKHLEEQIAEKDSELETLRANVGQAQKKITESLKAVAEKDLPV